MATGKASDFKIYENEMRGGVIETLTQASNYFNQAGGVLNMSTVSRRGQYAKESFFTNIASLVTRRDTTSVSTATDLALAMNEIISVKLKRKVGPVGQTLDAFKTVAMNAGSDQALSFLIGTQVAKAMEVDMLDSALRAGRAALSNQSAVYYDGTSGTMTASKLVSGLAKMGDNANKIKAFVMHSKVYFDLVQNQIVPANNGEGAATATVYGGSPATLGRPVIVTDSTALLLDDSPDLYYTLALTENGLVVENSEEETMYSELVTGLENLVVRLQGEFAYNLGVKGFKWDTGNGGANPLDAAVALGSNWDTAATSYKDYAGVCIATR
jgi:hypothetical protein